MARTAIARYLPPPRIVVMPRAVRRRSGGFRAFARRGRRRGRVGAPGGISTSLAFPVAIGGAAVGWAGAKGYLAKLPQIGGSRMTTLGILGFALMKFAKNRTVRAAGLSALAAAAFDFGRTQGGGTPLAGDDLLGDEGQGASAAGDDYPY